MLVPLAETGIVFEGNAGGVVGSDSVVNYTVIIGLEEEASVLIPENKVEAW